MNQTSTPNTDVALKSVTKEFPSRRGDPPVKAVDNISLDIADGEFFALLGPSGCGKTTTLRMIAGFEYPTRGEILIRGVPMQGVPPFHRPVNTVFQDYALFPHMTALQNVMFGLEMEGVPKALAQERALQALEMVQLPQAANRKPNALSGGQQQRVALARALVKNPTVLLLDEPLGALDLKLRKEMQYELKSMQERLGITFVYVTHDQEEALTMADRIAVMHAGHVLQVGTPREIYDQPHTRFVADFIGETNFIVGTLIEKDSHYGTVKLSDDQVIRAILDDSSITVNQSVTVAIRPEKITIQAASDTDDSTATSGHSNISLLNAHVVKSVYIGTDTRHVINIDGQHELVVRVQNLGAQTDYSFQEGASVYIYWQEDSARILRD